MNTKNIIAKLIKSGYPLRLIASQTGVSYMKLYRFYSEEKKLSEPEQAKIKAFAYMQPVFTRIIERQNDDK